MTPAACDIFLVRHGETTWNVTRTMQGQVSVESPLTERGEEQARVVAGPLQEAGVAALYSSDLLRVRPPAAPARAGPLYRAAQQTCAPQRVG
mmetsp:Transcript_32302/g.102731  ORF Transcript_32302/g.102731 Transcript_32302/m.102731 type:complete len:92 (+) Transcript_32302:394-669(+)